MVLRLSIWVDIDVCLAGTMETMVLNDNVVTAASSVIMLAGVVSILLGLGRWLVVIGTMLKGFCSWVTVGMFKGIVGRLMIGFCPWLDVAMLIGIVSMLMGFCPWLDVAMLLGIVSMFMGFCHWFDVTMLIGIVSMLIGFCPWFDVTMLGIGVCFPMVPFICCTMLTGFCVSLAHGEMSIEDFDVSEAFLYELEVADGVEAEFEVPKELDSDSVLGIDVSQLSSQEVALSMLYGEAVVPVRAELKDIKI